MPGHKVLIVEDEFLIRLTLAEALGDEGFTAIEAEAADQALVALAAHSDIILMMTDIQLPGGMDGRALAARARQTRPGLPVIFMTGRPDRMEPPTPQDLFVAKPYLPSEICAAVRRMTGI